MSPTEKKYEILEDPNYKEFKKTGSWLKLARLIRDKIQGEQRDNQQMEEGGPELWAFYKKEGRVAEHEGSALERYSQTLQSLLADQKEMLPKENLLVESMKKRKKGCVVLDLAGPGVVLEQLRQAGVDIKRGFSATIGTKKSISPITQDLSEPDSFSHKQIQGNLLFRSVMNEIQDQISENTAESPYQPLTETFFLPYGGLLFMPQGEHPRDYLWFHELLSRVWSRTSNRHGRIFFQVNPIFGIEVMKKWKEMLDKSGVIFRYKIEYDGAYPYIVGMLEKTFFSRGFPFLSESDIAELIRVRDSKVEQVVPNSPREDERKSSQSSMRKFLYKISEKFVGMVDERVNHHEKDNVDSPPGIAFVNVPRDPKNFQEKMRVRIYKLREWLKEQSEAG